MLLGMGKKKICLSANFCFLKQNLFEVQYYFYPLWPLLRRENQRTPIRCQGLVYTYPFSNIKLNVEYAYTEVHTGISWPTMDPTGPDT